MDYLKIKPHRVIPRTPKNFRLSLECQEMVKALAKAYETTQAQIIEEVITTYGPHLLKHKKKG